MANKITAVLDLDGKGFTSQLKAVQTSIKSADGAMGKMKATASGVGQVFKANMAEAATVAAGAIFEFGRRSVTAFQDTAIAAGKLADATGITVEEASRLAEVASDVGIELGTVQGALVRFNKAASDGEVEIEGFGNAVVRAEDGTVDAYESFINAATAIGAIEDPTKRAAAAQATFGRSYAEIAELMAMDAQELRSALAGVSDEQVIDADELRKARDFRASMDELQDAITRVQLAVGEGLVPKLTEAADGLVAISESDVASWAGELLGVIDRLTTDLPEVVQRFEQMNELITIWSGNEAIGQVGEAFDKVATSVEEAGSASRSTASDIEAMYESMGEAAQAEIAETQARLQGWLDQLNNIPDEKRTEIQAAIDAGQIGAAERLLNQLARTRFAAIFPVIQPATTGKNMTGPKSDASFVKSATSTLKGAVDEYNSALSGLGSGGGGGGGGGGASSPAQTEAEKWDDAIDKLFTYGQFTREEYMRYLEEQIAGEELLSDRRLELFRKLQSFKDQVAAEDAKRRQDQERAEKEAADEAKRRADELKKAADEAARASEQLTINVYSNSLDPMAVARAIEQAKKMAGRGFLQ